MGSLGGKKALSGATAIATFAKKNKNQKMSVKGKSGQRRRGTNAMKKG